MFLEDTVKLCLYAAPLAEAVAYVARALPARSPVPVLAGILLATGESGLTLSAFDYEVAAISAYEVEAQRQVRVNVQSSLQNAVLCFLAVRHDRGYGRSKSGSAGTVVG